MQCVLGLRSKVFLPNPHSCQPELTFICRERRSISGRTRRFSPTFPSLAVCLPISMIVGGGGGYRIGT